MTNGWLDKVKDYVKGNPQQADSALDKVEEALDQQTGGKYADQIDKGSDLLREQLGLPPEAPDGAPAPAPAGSTPDPADPTPDPTPAPNPSPATDDPQSPSEGDGPLIPGEPQRPGEPGGPLTPDQRPDGAPAPTP
jgi:hypothetical protein